MSNTINLDALAAQVQAAAGLKSITITGYQPNTPPSIDGEVLYDKLGRKRSPATLRSFRLGVKPGNYGRKFPATPPTEPEVLRMLEACPDNPAGRRGRGLIVLQWRSGLRVSEALALRRHDLNREAGTVWVARGKGGKSRMVGMDDWGFENLQPWIDERYERYPDGPIFCIVAGATKGQAWSTSSARTFMHKTAHNARIERRVAPHQLRHALACEMVREGLPTYVVQRQFGHASMATTNTYLAGISNEEVVAAVSARPAPGQRIAA